MPLPFLVWTSVKDRLGILWRGITNSPPHLFLAVGAVVLGIFGGFTYVVLAPTDTTGIILALNAVLLVFASVSFSASRAMDAGTEEMRQYRLAGEHFLQGSLWLLLLGVFRYAWWNELREVIIQIPTPFRPLLQIVLVFCLMLPFAVTALGVSVGFVTLHNVMFQRLGAQAKRPVSLAPPDSI